MKAEALVWALNKQLKDRNIAAVAVTLITKDGLAMDGYSINQLEDTHNGGLYQLLGAVEMLKQRLVNHGAPNIHEIADVIQANGLAEWFPDD